MKILVCGLPGSGKTWLSERLVKHLDNCAWYNADFVRKSANDWDFTLQGRIRQANRMKAFADFEISNGRWVICDFVAPTNKARETFNPDYMIWLDTIEQGRVVSSKINELKELLLKESKNIKDKATQIKITEVSKFLTELKKTDKVGDDNLVDLLRYYELVKEIKVANAIQI